MLHGFSEVRGNYLLTGVSFSSNLEEGRQLQRGGGWSELGPEGARPEPSPAAMRPEGLNPYLERTQAWQQPNSSKLCLLYTSDAADE